MKATNNNPTALKILQPWKDGHLLLDVFKNNNRALDEIQKRLEDLLEKKRCEFARFYFVSNDELLQILADCSKNVENVQPHLRKLFENINLVEFEMDDIAKIISAEKEVIKVKKVKTANQPCEKWLSSLEEHMRMGVAKFIKTANDAYKDDNEDFKRSHWVMEDHPAQAVCVVGSIMWCMSTEFSLKNEDEVRESLDWWYNENVSQLEELTKIVCRQDIVPKKRKAVVALIT